MTRDPVILFVLSTACAGAYVAACAMGDAGYWTEGVVFMAIALIFLTATAKVACSSS